MLVVPRKICRLGGSAGSVVEYVNINNNIIIKINIIFKGKIESSKWLTILLIIVTELS